MNDTWVFISSTLAIAIIPMVHTRVHVYWWVGRRTEEEQQKKVQRNKFLNSWPCLRRVRPIFLSELSIVILFWAYCTIFHMVYQLHMQCLISVNQTRYLYAHIRWAGWLILLFITAAIAKKFSLQLPLVDIILHQPIQSTTAWTHTNKPNQQNKLPIDNS